MSCAEPGYGPFAAPRLPAGWPAGLTDVHDQSSMTGQTLLITVTGPDRPGVSRAFFDALAAYEVLVLDIEQVVVRGRLTLALPVTDWHPADADALTRAVLTVGEDLALEVSLEFGTANSARRRTGRAAA